MSVEVLSYRATGFPHAYTRYMFPDTASTYRYLENPGTGPTSKFRAEFSQRLACCGSWVP